MFRQHLILDSDTIGFVCLNLISLNGSYIRQNQNGMALIRNLLTQFYFLVIPKPSFTNYFLKHFFNGYMSQVRLTS